MHFENTWAEAPTPPPIEEAMTMLAREKARGPRLVAVGAAEHGTSLLDEAQIRARWTIFSSRSSQAAKSAFSNKTSKADYVSCALPGDQPCPEKWLGKDQLAADACDALGRMAKPQGTKDSVPTEHLRAAGPGCLRAFARLAWRSVQDGAPSRWRRGSMVPVPKKQRVPLSAKNARGVLLACHSGKIYSRIVRIKISTYCLRLPRAGSQAE